MHFITLFIFQDIKTNANKLFEKLETIVVCINITNKRINNFQNLSLQFTIKYFVINSYNSLIITRR